MQVLYLLLLKLEEFAWEGNTYIEKVGLKYVKHWKSPFAHLPRKVVSIQKKKKKEKKNLWGWNDLCESIHVLMDEVATV